MSTTQITPADPSRRYVRTGGPPMARHKSRITEKGYRAGIPNPNKGKRFFVETLTPEEILAMEDQCNTATRA